MTTALLGTLMIVVGLLSVVATIAGLPGTWVVLLAALALQWWRPDTYDWWTLGVAGGLVILAEVVEFAAGAMGAGKAGGSKRAALAATVGGLIGALVGTVVIPVLIVGTIVGAAVGSGVGALALERTKQGRTWGDAGRVAQGAFVGRLVATVVKGALALVLAVILAAAVFIA